MKLGRNALLFTLFASAGVHGPSLAEPYSQKQYDEEELTMAEDLVSKPRHKSILIKLFSADDYQRCYPFTVLGERMAADGTLDAKNSAAISGMEELGAVAMAFSVVGGLGKEAVKEIQQSTLKRFKEDPKAYTDQHMSYCSKKSASIISQIMEGQSRKSEHKK